MDDEGRDRQLPRRARGATGAPVAPAPPPVLSDELRRRMRAAITAERARTPAQKPAQEQESFSAGEVTSPPANGAEDQAGPGSGRPAPPRHVALPARPPGAGPVAPPIVEDEITEWLGPAAGAEHAAAGAQDAAAAGPATPDRPEPRPGADEAAGLRPVRLPRAWMGLVVAGLVIGSLAAVVARHVTGSPENGAASAAAARQEAARDEAAAWIVQQVSRDVIVSCDPAMCHTLTAYGYPARDLLTLGPTSPDPVTAGVVVETAAVQGLFGSSLATAWAPAVLASFGSGPAAITVRVMAPHGAAAYQRALSGDLADRKNAGAGLLKDPQITVPALASGQLTAGLVDARLLRALATLARHQPITIVEFGNTGPGASAGVPLRFVDLAEHDRAAQLSRAAYLRSVRAYLSTVNASFRPATMTTVVLASGQAVLRVQVTAPSPLGVFGTQGPG